MPALNHTFIGRFDVVEIQNMPVVRFDAMGFEIQFNVQGATEVKVLLEQTLSGPFGWFARPDLRSQYFSQQRPKPFHSRHQKHGMAHVSPIEMMQPPGSQPHHFLVYVDGVPQTTPLQRVQACRECTFDTADAVAEQATPYPVAIGLSPSRSYSIRIVKTSEPEWCSVAPTPNWLAFHGLLLDSGEVVQPTKSSPQHRIEFIGDSWMVGFANVCNGTYNEATGSNMGGEPLEVVRMGSFAYAWPFVACEALGAECHSTLLSGMGVYCNTHSDTEDFDCLSEDRLPQFWRRTLATVNTSKWNMAAWTPTAVVISASQNDHMFNPRRSKVEAIRTYANFIHDVASSYPTAHIILTCGPFSHESADLVGGPECKVVEEAVRRQEKQGVKVQFLSMMHFAKDVALGECQGHMNKEYAKTVGNQFSEWLQDNL